MNGSPIAAERYLGHSIHVHDGCAHPIAILSTFAHSLGRSLKRKSKREREVIGGRLKPCPAPDSPYRVPVSRTRNGQRWLSRLLNLTFILDYKYLLTYLKYCLLVGAAFILKGRQLQAFRYFFFRRYPCRYPRR